MKILIIDDELVSRKKMVKIMESYGKITEVETGSMALAQFMKAVDRHIPFDLITLDIGMPYMDGTEVLYKIRDVENKKNIPDEERVKVIMVTAQSDKDSIITCLQAGCNDYVVKPFNAEIVRAKLEKLGLIKL